MDITKVLTISTAHITEETDRKLQDESEVNNMCISVYDKSDYGYWIYIDPYDRLMCNKNIPADSSISVLLQEGVGIPKFIANFITNAVENDT